MKNAVFSTEEAKLIISTRIRVGRNLKGYPLGSGVTKSQRLEIMEKVISACNTFTDHMAGQFYKLEGMNSKD